MGNTCCVNLRHLELQPNSNQIKNHQNADAQSN